MKARHAVLRVALLALAGILLGLSFFRWNARTLGGNQMPMPFGWGLSVVLSGSMEPTLSVDDLVVVRQAEEIRPGDVVVYQDGRSLVLHRVIAVEGDTLTTQGDANNMADPPVRREAVKGVMVRAIPGVGAAVRVVREPVVAAAMLLAALLLAERSFRRDRKQDEDELEEIQAEIRALAEEIKQKHP